MRKVLRSLFLAVILVACFQLVGFEEAFCDDSIPDTGCENCLTCLGHQFTGLPEPESFFDVAFSSYYVLKNPFQKMEEPSFNFFHPPIFV